MEHYIFYLILLNYNYLLLSFNLSFVLTIKSNHVTNIRRFMFILCIFGTKWFLSRTKWQISMWEINISPLCLWLSHKRQQTYLTKSYLGRTWYNSSSALLFSSKNACVLSSTKSSRLFAYSSMRERRLSKNLSPVLSLKTNNS